MYCIAVGLSKGVVVGIFRFFYSSTIPIFRFFDFPIRYLRISPSLAIDTYSISDEICASSRKLVDALVPS